MIGPVALRAAVEVLRSEFAMKKRRACRVVGLAPATYYYRARRPDPVELREKLKAFAAQRPRWGYRRLHVLLRRDGDVVNHKRVYRVYRAEGLAVRRKKRKRMAASLRVVPPPPTSPRQQKPCRRSTASLTLFAAHPTRASRGATSSFASSARISSPVPAAVAGRWLLFINKRSVIEQTLGHLGLPTKGPPTAPARLPAPSSRCSGKTTSPSCSNRCADSPVRPNALNSPAGRLLGLAALESATPVEMEQEGARRHKATYPTYGVTCFLSSRSLRFQSRYV
jgi:hypothetical protein